MLLFFSNWIGCLKTRYFLIVQVKLDVLSIAALALAHDAGSSMASSCAAFRQAARYFTPRRGATERRPIVLTLERLGENCFYPLVYVNFSSLFCLK